MHIRSLAVVCLPAMLAASGASAEIVTYTYNPPLQFGGGGGSFFGLHYGNYGLPLGAYGGFNGPEIFTLYPSIYGDIYVLDDVGVPLRPGDLIGPNLAFGSDRASLTEFTFDDHNLYLGIRMFGNGSNGYAYGWLNVVRHNETYGSVIGWGMETTPDMPIPAGAVPSPASALLFVCFGVAALRHRNIGTM